MFSTLKQSLPSCGISQTEASRFDKVFSFETKAGFRIAGITPLSIISPFCLKITFSPSSTCSKLSSWISSMIACFKIARITR